MIRFILHLDKDARAGFYLILGLIATEWFMLETDNGLEIAWPLLQWFVLCYIALLSLVFAKVLQVEWHEWKGSVSKI